MRTRMLAALSFSILVILSIMITGQRNVSSQTQTGSPSSGFCDNTGRPFGDVKVLAQVPYPGYPEGIAVEDNKIYVAGAVAPYSSKGQDVHFPNPTEQSMLFEFDKCTGALLRQFEVNKNQLPINPRAVSHVAFDGRGRAYVPEFQAGIFRLYLDGNNRQELYATIVPDLPACPGGVVVPGVACSPTLTDERPIMNEMAFDARGNLYLSDSNQATIWRIPPRGPLPRQAEIYFRSSRFDAEGGFGPNGLRVSPDGKKLFIAISDDGVTPRGARSGIYTIPLKNNPNNLSESDLKLFHLYPAADLPDGIAFGKSGLLYVVLLNPASPPPGGFVVPPGFRLPVGPFFGGGVSILRRNGTEKTRITDATMFDSPACAAFNGKGSLVVTNHAFLTGNRLKMQVLDVFVDDKESPLFKPNLDNGNGSSGNDGHDDDDDDGHDDDDDN